MRLSNVSRTQNKMLSTTEAALRLGVSKSTIREMCRDGKFPGVQKDPKTGAWKIPENDLQAHSTKTIPQNTPKANWFEIIKGNLFIQIILALGALAAFLATITGGFADWGPATDQLQQLGWISDIEKASESELLIVIFNFHTTSGVVDANIQGEIKRAIEKIINEQNIENVRIEIDPRILKAEERNKAERIAEKFDASILIWGEDTGVRVTVNFLNVREPNFDASDISISETELSQLANPPGYVSFITEELPNKLSFLSFFAVGQSYILNGEIENATQTIERAIESLQDKEFTGLFEAYYSLSWLYELSGRYENALLSANQAIKINPTSGIAYNNRGMVKAALQDLEGALSDLQEAKRIEPNEPFYHVNLGLLYYFSGEYELAIANYSNAINVAPTFSVAFMNRGNVYDFQGKKDEALLDYNNAIRLSPRFSDAYYNRGILHLSLDELELALADFSETIKLTPDHVQAYVNRGEIQYKLHNYLEAIQDFNSALNFYPENKTFWLTSINPRIGIKAALYYDWFTEPGEIYYKRGLAYSELSNSNPSAVEDSIADFGRAINFYLTASNLISATIYISSPIDLLTDSYYQRGIIFFEKEDYTSAENDFSEILGRLPIPETECYVELGEVICPFGKGSDNIGEVNSDPYLARVFNFRGMSRRQLGDFTGALADYNLAIQLHPDQFDFYNNRSNAYRFLNKFDESLKDINIALELNPLDYILLMNRAFTYEALKDYPNAIKDCDTAISIEPRIGEAYYWKGKYSKEIGNIPQAIESLQKYLELTPDADDYQVVEKMIEDLKSLP